MVSRQFAQLSNLLIIMRAKFIYLRPVHVPEVVLGMLPGAFDLISVDIDGVAALLIDTLRLERLFVVDDVMLKSLRL